MTEQRGAGRPPMYDAPMIAKLVSLPTDYWQYLADELGGFSPGIRQLIEEHQERDYEALNKRRKRVIRQARKST